MKILFPLRDSRGYDLLIMTKLEFPDKIHLQTLSKPVRCNWGYQDYRFFIPWHRK